MIITMNNLLTEESRSNLINYFIEAELKDAKETDGVDCHFHCDHFNGRKGYTNFTDRELLAQAVFWQFGFDVEWRKKEV